MTVIEAFVFNVRMTLTKKRWTQIKLAEESGINYHSLNGILCGNNGPSLYTAYAISEALGVTLDELTEGADE